VYWLLSTFLQQGDAMAKKSANNSHRSNPKANKSLAIRNVLNRMPTGSYAEVAKAVKSEFGHDVKSSLFYMLKAKGNMKANTRANQAKAQPAKETPAPMNSAATWVEAIKLARNLLRATGSIENATAVLKAVDG